MLAGVAGIPERGSSSVKAGTRTGEEMKETLPSTIQPPHAPQKLRTWLGVSGGLDLTFSASCRVVKPIPARPRRCDPGFYRHPQVLARIHECRRWRGHIVRHPRRGSLTRERFGRLPKNPPPPLTPGGGHARRCSTTCVSR